MTALHCITHSSHRKRGSALIYILVAIALLGALTASVVGTSSMQSDAQRAEKLKMELKAQITMISNAINECVNLYPDGDPTFGGVSGYVHPYPLTPTSPHFTGSTLGVAPDNKIIHLRCPGNPGIDNNHEPLFGGNSGRNISPLPEVFNHNHWNYNNNTVTWAGDTTEGVYLRNSTANTDPYIWKAFQMLDDEFPDCQFDVIQGDGTNGCANNNFCLRFFLVRKQPACP